MISKIINCKIAIVVSIILLTLISSSCFKEEDKIPMPENTGTITLIELGKDYEYQVYYSIEKDTVLAQNMCSEWDLGFEASAQGWHIVLNTANFMFAANTNSTNFDSVFFASEEDLHWKWDNSNGNLDSTAIGNWLESNSNLTNPVYTNKVYIINRGASQTGEKYGFKKVVFQYVDNDFYRIKYANLDGSQTGTAEIVKDTIRNFVQFSFQDDRTHYFEPEKTEWDLLFTRYTYIFYADDPDAPIPVPGEYLPYTVVGTLINRNNTKAARIENMDYNLIDSTNISDEFAYDYSADIDAIGWNWKRFSNNKYVVDPYLSFGVRTQQNSYYKLRFKNFYQDGIKGYPTIQYEKVIY